MPRFRLLTVCLSGGAQNAARKEPKDKREKLEKKDKKSSTNLRGIRNFV